MRNLPRFRRRETDRAAGIRLWRHHDERTHDLPGIFLGEEPVAPDPVRQSRDLVERGARMVSLERPIDLRRASTASVGALALVRELTGHGVVVRWSLADAPELDLAGALGHLYPPAAMAGRPDDDATSAAWRGRFYIGKCVFRNGPGFMQVRDRRSGVLQRFTIDEPRYLDAIGGLIDGTPEKNLPGDVVAALAAEGLVVRFGTHLWWAPYRIRRWPQPSMIV